jgi:HEPN domain-containing protein
MRRSFPVMWLFHRAMEFEEAYHAVPEMPPLSWPRYFLLCHSIELALKAFLTLHGESESDLMLIGHDLKKLLKHAEKCGLKLDPDTQDAIKRLAKAHKHHWARYPNENIRRVYAIEQFEKNATELLQQVRVAIYPPPPP